MGLRGTRGQGCGKKLYNEVLHDLYCSPNIVRAIRSRIMRWAEHVARMGERRVILVVKPEGKWRPRHRWEDNIKMDFLKVGCGGMNCIEMAQVKERWRSHVNEIMKLRVP